MWETLLVVRVFLLEISSQMMEVYPKNETNLPPCVTFTPPGGDWHSINNRTHTGSLPSGYMGRTRDGPKTTTPVPVDLDARSERRSH